MWKFTAHERLEDLVSRARAQETFLTRERADHHTPADRARIDARIDVVHRRIRVLCDAARKARRTANAMATNV